MSHNGVCALILAAGLSTRMRPLLLGSSKALCPLEGVSLLERCCTFFRLSGVERIYVVTGHGHHEVAPAVSALGAVAVYNERYPEGMFSSVTAGLATLMEHDENNAFFLLPVDIPLVSPAIAMSLQKYWNALSQTPEQEGEGRFHRDSGRKHELMKSSRKREEAILLPVIGGESGHPPLIGRAHWAEILAWKGENGLQGYMAKMQREGFQGRPCIYALPVDDEAVLRDIDTPGDLEQATRFLRGCGE